MGLLDDFYDPRMDPSTNEFIIYNEVMDEEDAEFEEDEFDVDDFDSDFDE